MNTSDTFPTSPKPARMTVVEIGLPILLLRYLGSAFALAASAVAAEVHLAQGVVSSCMNYVAFHLGHGGRGGGYQGPDKPLGYPALVPILAFSPDFWVGDGDNVYYDHNKSKIAKTVVEMRAKWHEQFAMPRLVEMLAKVPAYFLKDDHEYRYNDADRTPGVEPSHELGVRIFREQVPIVDPADPNAVTYRTHRAGRHLQIWFLEGRDYRTSNTMPDGRDFRALARRMPCFSVSSDCRLPNGFGASPGTSTPILCPA